MDDFWDVMMTEHEAFMQAIIADPTDDAPRLVFADWLEEQGQSERAEFIRIQCQMAAIKPNGCQYMKAIGNLLGFPVVETGTECGKCQWCLLTEREQVLYRYQPGLSCFLYRQLCSDFGGVDPRIIDVKFTESHPRVCGMKFSKSVNMANSVECVFRRGFIAEVTLACQDWLTHREQLLRMMPLEKVTITNATHKMIQGGATVVLLRGQSLFGYNRSDGYWDLSFPRWTPQKGFEVGDGKHWEPWRNYAAENVEWTSVRG